MTPVSWLFVGWLLLHLWKVASNISGNSNLNGIRQDVVSFGISIGSVILVPSDLWQDSKVLTQVFVVENYLVSFTEIFVSTSTTCNLPCLVVGVLVWESYFLCSPKTSSLWCPPFIFKSGTFTNTGSINLLHKTLTLYRRRKKGFFLNKNKN